MAGPGQILALTMFRSKRCTVCFLLPPSWYCTKNKKLNAAMNSLHPWDFFLCFIGFFAHSECCCHFYYYFAVQLAKTSQPVLLDLGWVCPCSTLPHYFPVLPPLDPLLIVSWSLCFYFTHSLSEICVWNQETPPWIESIEKCYQVLHRF